MNNNLDYGQAIIAITKGKMIARKGWSNKSMFVFKQIPAEIGLDIIPGMQSVPNSVKDLIINRGVTLKYSNQMAIVDSNGNVNSWVASSIDTFAIDWYILD